MKKALIMALLAITIPAGAEIVEVDADTSELIFTFTPILLAECVTATAAQRGYEDEKTCTQDLVDAGDCASRDLGQPVANPQSKEDFAQDFWLHLITRGVSAERTQSEIETSEDNRETRDQDIEDGSSTSRGGR